jgi:sialate O-acetylesterase
MKKLVLSSHMVPNPIHYRYAWGRSPLGNLQVHHVTDIPFATQRSDEWTFEEIPLGVLGENPPATLDRRQRNQIIKALKLEDTRRRLKKARLLIDENAGLGA